MLKYLKILKHQYWPLTSLVTLAGSIIISYLYILKCVLYTLNNNFRWNQHEIAPMNQLWNLVISKRTKGGNRGQNLFFPYNSGLNASNFTQIGISNSYVTSFVLKITKLDSIKNCTSYDTSSEKDNQMGLYSDFTNF